jgi:hypothetical protein
MLKEINNFDPLIYESYFVVGTTEDISIEYFTSNGYIVFEDYDLYKMPEGTLIAFKDIKDNYWITNYRVRYESESLILQSQYYEKILDILNEENLYPNSVHAFANSVELFNNNNLNSTIYNPEERCDFNKYGPSAFYAAAPNRKIGKILQYRSILSVTGIAHLNRIDIEDLSEAYNDNSGNQSMNQTARTLSGSLKQIDEWKQVNEEPWNNTELISIKAKQFLEALNIPQETIKDVVSNQIDMRVFKYLQGELDIHKPLNEADVMPESFKKYLMDHYRYKSIKNLRLFHSNGNLIDESIEQKEFEILDESVSFYCMLNNLDRITMSLQEISDHAYQMTHYIDHNNSITDVIRKLTM